MKKCVANACTVEQKSVSKIEQMEVKKLLEHIWFKHRTYRPEPGLWENPIYRAGQDLTTQTGAWLHYNLSWCR